MKKPIFFILIISLLSGVLTIFPHTKTVNAESLYLRVITNDTPFYQDVNDVEPLFFLPYTYYVRVIESGTTYTHVECKANNSAPAIDGYVPTDMLYSDQLTVVEPYLNILVRTATTALLFEDSLLTTPIQYVFSEREMNYYGKYVNQAGYIVYYVSYNNRLGYVKEADIYPFSYPNHPNELTFIKPETPPETDKTPISPSTENEGALSIKIIIVFSLIFAGVIALVFALKNKPTRSSAVTFYDENDYE